MPSHPDAMASRADERETRVMASRGPARRIGGTLASGGRWASIGSPSGVGGAAVGVGRDGHDERGAHEGPRGQDLGATAPGLGPRGLVHGRG